MFKLSSKTYFILLSLLLVISGCSSSNGASGSKNEKTSNAKSGSKKVVTLWWNVDESTPTGKSHYDAIKKYMEENPDIEIQSQTMPYDQLKQKLTTANAAGGTPPDVAFGLNEWIADLYQMGALEDLTAEVNKWEAKGKIADTVWNGMNVDGKIVAIPETLKIRANMYHKSMLEKAGITSPPKTWSELLAAGKTIKEAGVKYPYGIATDSSRGPQELAIYFWGNNVDIVSAVSGGKFRNTWLENPEELKGATEVFQFYKNMLDSGVIAKSEASWDYTALDQNLAQGSVAIAQDGPWMQNYIEKNPDGMKDLVVENVPVYNKKPATFIELSPFFTFKNSPHKQEALKLMQWLVSKEAQEIYAANRSVRSDVTVSGMWGEGFAKLVANGRTWPPVPLGGITKSMQESIQMVLVGGKSPEDTAKWLAEQINKSLEENGLLGK